jgi:hypothetical protein
LIERLRGGADDDSANELLKEMFRGYPIANIQRLIHSENPLAVKSGAWIVSELVHREPALMSDVKMLLDHPNRNVRFWAVDAVLVGAGTHHGELIAKAIALIADPERAVRWNVLRFLARSPQANLNASEPYIENVELRELTRWLATVGTGPSSRQEVSAGLADSDKLTRMFAAAAAVRLAPDDRGFLEEALGSTDPEVSSFAKDELALPHR